MAFVGPLAIAGRARWKSPHRAASTIFSAGRNPADRIEDESFVIVPWAALQNGAAKIHGVDDASPSDETYLLPLMQNSASRLIVTLGADSQLRENAGTFSRVAMQETAAAQAQPENLS
jgi:hypothetical protein